jgi:hypothetical protein
MSTSGADTILDIEFDGRTIRVDKASERGSGGGTSYLYYVDSPCRYADLLS